GLLLLLRCFPSGLPCRFKLCFAEIESLVARAEDTTDRVPPLCSELRVERGTRNWSDRVPGDVHVRGGRLAYQADGPVAQLTHLGTLFDVLCDESGTDPLGHAVGLVGGHELGDHFRRYPPPHHRAAADRCFGFRDAVEVPHQVLERLEVTLHSSVEIGRAHV